MRTILIGLAMACIALPVLAQTRDQNAGQFLLAMNELAGEEPYNTALEITVDVGRRVTIARYPLSR